MCKNMMIAGLKPEFTTLGNSARKIPQGKVWDFLVAAAEFMNNNDRDGLGYAAQTPDGVWGERWLRPTDAWNYRQVWTDEDNKLLKEYKGTLKAEPRYNHFGRSGDGTHAIIYHARMATCERGLHNVHPFVTKDTALIHNGVIHNADSFKLEQSTCDSESILISYLKHKVNEAPTNVEKMADDLRGGYACGILTHDANGRQVMDIFRTSTQRLYAYWVHELEATVFCTSSEIIRNTCKKLKWKYGSTFEFSDEVLIRLDAKTGELITSVKFKPTYSSWSSSNYNKRRDNQDEDYWKNFGGPGGRDHIPDTRGTEEKKSPPALTQEAKEMIRALTPDTSPKNNGQSCATDTSTVSSTVADEATGKGGETPCADPFGTYGEGCAM